MSLSPLFVKTLKYLVSRGTVRWGGYLLLIAVLLLSFSSNAQNPNNNRLIVVTNTQLNWGLNTPAELETNQVISNAITLDVKSQNSNCTLYARLSAYTYPSGFIPTSCPIYLDFTSTTANNATNIAQLIQVSTSDQMLFKQGNSPSIRYYYYDVYLSPLGYTDYPVGSYYFTITFTMTQP